jgi:competence protein ComGC
MAKSEGKGSILLKIVIVVLVIITILVIKIPNDIWQEEERIQEQCRENMTSIYEAHMYYQKVHGEHIRDSQPLITSIQNDSTLLKRDKIVTYTTRLVTATESFMRIPAISDLHGIQINILNIIDDLESNQRYFKGYTEIDDQTQDILLNLSGLNLGGEYEKYRFVSSALDTLWQVRRDLSEHPLQIAAMRISSLAGKAADNLGDVDFTDLENLWKPTSDKVSRLMKRINDEEQLRTKTNVVYRLIKFRDNINSIFKNRSNYDLNTSYQLANAGKENFKQVYQEFLADFLITENVAQFRLSDEDSMLINLSESNFYTPLDHEPYIIVLTDTGGINVEDPTLLSELQQKAAVPLEKMQKLPFLEPIKSYFATLDSINLFTKELKSTYRRNKDLPPRILEVNITIEAEITELGEVKNFKDLISAIDGLQDNNSFYEIKNLLEEGHTAIHQIGQRFEQNLFRLDTIHAGLVYHINRLDSTLQNISRNTYSIAPLRLQLENFYNQYKSVSAAEINTQITSIKQDIEDIVKFAAEGSTIPVYSLFSLKVQNHGRVYARTGEKSWEEEQ